MNNQVKGILNRNINSDMNEDDYFFKNMYYCFKKIMLTFMTSF